MESCAKGPGMARRRTSFLSTLPSRQCAAPEAPVVNVSAACTQALVVDGKPAKAKQLAEDIIHCVEDRGLLLLSCGTYDNTIRWIPPLNVTSEQINDGLQIFESALKEVIK